MIITRASDTAKMHLVVLASGLTTFVLMMAVTFYHGNGLPLFFLPTILHAWVLQRLGWRMVSNRRVDQD